MTLKPKTRKAHFCDGLQSVKALTRRTKQLIQEASWSAMAREYGHPEIMTSYQKKTSQTIRNINCLLRSRKMSKSEKDKLGTLREKVKLLQHVQHIQPLLKRKIQ